MIERKTGSIVNIASVAGKAGTAYIATKQGVIVFTKHLFAEYAGYGIKVNAILYPTFMKTTLGWCSSR